MATSVPTDEAEVVPGGAITYAYSTDMQTFDPALMPWVNHQQMIGSMVFGSLVYENHETEIVYDMAVSVTTADDGLTWTIKLRDGLVFSDGTPYDADAVVFNWDRITDPEMTSPLAGVFANIASYEAVDSTTVVVTLKSVNTQFVRALQYIGFIGSPTAIDELGDTFGSNPVGAGPFISDEWVRESSHTFVRNPTYWDQPRPYLDEVELTFISDATQRYNTLVSGGASASFADTGEQFQEWQDSGGVALPMEQLGGVGVGFSLTKPPFDDIRARRAVEMALNSEEITNIVFPGARPAVSIFPPERSYSSGATYPAHDLDAAQALVDEYLAETGESTLSFTYSYIAGNAAYDRLASVFQAEIGELQNVEVTLNPVPLSEYVTRRNQDEFQIVYDGLLGPSWPDPKIYERFHTGGSGNWMGYSNPDVDALLEQSRTVSDNDELLGIYAQLEALLIEDGPYLNLTYLEYGIMHATSVHDLIRFGDAAVRFEAAWVSQD